MKSIKLSAKTPSQGVTLFIEVGINDWHMKNVFCVTVSSPELFFQSEGEINGCSYSTTYLFGFLQTLEIQDNWRLRFGFTPDKDSDDWDEDYSSISAHVDTKEEVEHIVSELVKGFKSFYKAKRYDFLLKQSWLSKWEFIEE